MGLGVNYIASTSQVYIKRACGTFERLGSYELNVRMISVIDL